MSTKKKKSRSGQGMNFAVTIVTLSLIFIFFGYLIGQYAVNLLKEQHNVTMQMAREEAAVVSTQGNIPAPVAPAQTGSASTSNQQQASSSVTSSIVPQTTGQTPSTFLYRVQVGVFSEKANADRMVAQLKEAGYEALLITGPPHRVQTGAFSSQENAAKLMDELKKKGFEAIIVR